jgi:hypothetical protein
MYSQVVNDEINNDFLLSQLKLHISEMEKNSRIFDRLNKKLIAFQQE